MSRHKGIVIQMLMVMLASSGRCPHINVMAIRDIYVAAMHTKQCVFPHRSIVVDRISERFPQHILRNIHSKELQKRRA